MQTKKPAVGPRVDRGVRPGSEAPEPVAWQSTSGGSFVSAEAWRNVPIYREVYTVPLVTMAQAEAMVAAERERCVPDVDELAQHIRWLNGSNKMGAGRLAEQLVEWLRSRA